MGTPSPADRPSGSEVARFLTRKLLFVILFVFVSAYLIYSHSSEISSYVPTRPFSVPSVGNSASKQTTTTNGAAKTIGKPPSPYHPHSHDNFVYLDLTKDFWAPWAKAMTRAKPALEEIKPRVAASNTPLGKTTEHQARVPPADYVDLSAGNLRKLTEAHQQLREKLDSYDPRADLNDMFHHRGVVIVGGGEFMGPAVVSIKMLRAAGSELPVEVFVADWDEYEPELCEEYFPNELKARCLVISDFLIEAASHDIRKQVGHYQLKSMALLFCTFRNVLLLDSDSIPLVDPGQLFDSQAFVATGLLSWPDFWIATESPKFYEIAGLQDFPEDLAPTSSEAGQVVIDKQRHMHTLLLAVYYNVWGPKIFYPLLSQGSLGQGDKNTIESAAVVMNATYYRVPKRVQDVGRYAGGEKLGFKGSGMVQFMPETDVDETNLHDLSLSPKSTKPAFIHANTPKMNAGHLVDEGDLHASDGKRLRLWGTKEEQQKLFGKDLEKEVWTIVRDTGCELAPIVKEWRERKDVCDRLKQHWDEVFANA